MRIEGKLPRGLPPGSSVALANCLCRISRALHSCHETTAASPARAGLLFSPNRMQRRLRKPGDVAWTASTGGAPTFARVVACRLHEGFVVLHLNRPSHEPQRARSPDTEATEQDKMFGSVLSVSQLGELCGEMDCQRDRSGREIILQVGAIAVVFLPTSHLSLVTPALSIPPSRFPMPSRAITPTPKGAQTGVCKTDALPKPSPASRLLRLAKTLCAVWATRPSLMTPSPALASGLPPGGWWEP